MKISHFIRLKNPVLLLGLWVLLVSIPFFHLTTAVAEEKSEDSAAKTAPAVAADEKISVPDEEKAKSTDPNTPDSEDTVDENSDIFELKLSSLVLINEAYGRIFTPELITEEGLVKYSTLKRKRLDVLTAKRELKNLNPAQNGGVL